MTVEVWISVMGKKKVFEKIDKCGKLASFNNIPGMENEERT